MWARLATLVLWVVCLVGFLGVSGLRGGENKLRGLRVAIGPDVAKDGLVVASEGEHSVLSQDPLQSSVGGLVVELLISDVADAVAGVHGVLDGEAAVDREALGL